MTDAIRPYTAANRFGLGARGTGGAPARDAATLLTDLARFNPTPPELAAVPTRAQVAEGVIAYRNAVQEVLRNGPGEPDPAEAMAPAGTYENNTPEAQAIRRVMRRDNRADMRQHYLASLAARFDAAVASDTPFAERLVHFWSNHFAVSVDKVVVVGFAGLHEFESIRPHIGGNFLSLAWAAATHPAMLLYLDQAQSIGPDSQLAQAANARRRRRDAPELGLNENLAREILELHTLGVDGGYSQADVTEFARALTGITIPGLAPGPARRFLGDAPPGEVRFVPVLHQPGARTVMGQRYPEANGDTQARSILATLVRHPSTARHLSFKLARHFVADDPPTALVDRLTASWLSTGGDLLPWYRTLLTAPEAWSPAPAKARTPWEWAVATGRALGWPRTPRPQALAGLFNELGQPVWRPGSPAGYDDIAPSWLAPDALLRRIEAADRLAGLASLTLDPRALATTLFGPALSETTATALARAESPRQALALLLVSPEFLRR